MAEGVTAGLARPALAADPEVLEAAQDGFATVVKLPLRDDAAGAAGPARLSRAISTPASESCRLRVRRP